MTSTTKRPLAPFISCLALAVITGLALGVAVAQDWGSIAGGDANAGRDIVESECGGCHSSGYTGLLVSASHLSQDDVAGRVLDRAGLLRVLRYQRHPRMPQYLFSDSQTNSILAYFAQLRESGPQHPLPQSPNR